MALLCGLLRVSWISCLLISSVTCLPAAKGFSNPAPSGFVGWQSTSGSNNPNAGRLDSSASFPSTSGSLLQFPAAQNSNNKPGSVGWGGSFSGSQATGSINNAGVPYGAHYGSLASTGNDARYGGHGNAGVDTGLYYANSGSTDGGNTQFYSEGAVEESSEPVLRELSDLEPVYAYRSRSRYQHGRSQFSQTRYTPEVQLQSMPVAMSGPEHFPHAPAKGGF